MRIALYHNLPSGGAKRHTLEQVRELSRRGVEFVEYAPSTADFDYCSFAPYVSKRVTYAFSPVSLFRHIPLVSPYIHAVQGRAILRDLEQVNRQIAAEIDAAAFDAIFVKDCHLSMNPPILRHLQTPSVFQCHHGLRHRLGSEATAQRTDGGGVTNRLKSVYYRPAKNLFDTALWRSERLSARSASRVLTNSDFSRQLLARYYGVNARVIYPGINTSVFRPLSLDRQDYILSVGALIYGKGYRFLVSAMGRLDPERRPALFIAANSAEPAEEQVVRDMAARSGVRIHVERIVDDDRLVRVYNQARVFVYAPVQEALGMAPLEAMACGTPVLAVGEGGVRETVRDGETGWLVDRDSAAFAERLAQILADSSVRQRLGQAGIEAVRRDWTWKRAIDQLEQELLAVRAGKADCRKQ